MNLSPMNGSTLLRITEEGEVYHPLFRFVSRFVIGQSRRIAWPLARWGRLKPAPPKANAMAKCRNSKRNAILPDLGKGLVD